VEYWPKPVFESILERHFHIIVAIAAAKTTLELRLPFVVVAVFLFKKSLGRKLPKPPISGLIKLQVQIAG